MKSLHSKLLILILGCILVSAIAFSGIGIYNATVYVDQDSTQIMSLLCEEKTIEMNSLLLAVEQSVNTIYNYSVNELGDLNTLWNDEAALNEYMNRVQGVIKNAAENTACAAAVYLRFNIDLAPPVSGIFLTRQNNTNTFITCNPTDLSLYAKEDTGHVGWYYIPLENGRATWMEPYENKNIDVNMISYVIPIYKNDVTVGIIGMDIDLNLLREKVSSVQVYDTGYAFLSDSNGNLVYHKDFPTGMSKDDYPKNLEDFMTLLSQDTNKVYTYIWNGEQKKLIFNTLINGMSLGISVPSSEIDKYQNKLIKLSLIALFIIIAVASIITVRFTCKMTKPLRELTIAAGKIADGDMSVTIDCNTKDEVGILAESFRYTAKELKKYMDYINKLAYTDALTGILNKTAYEETVARLTESIRSSTGNFSVFVMDINNLKKMNDSFGHEKGDQMILDAVSIIKTVFGENPIYRIGGDEFVVIIEPCNDAKTYAYLSDLSYEIDSFHESHPHYEVDLYFAAGAAIYQKDLDKDYKDVFVRADKAMYQNKADLKRKL